MMTTYFLLLITPTLLISNGDNSSTREAISTTFIAVYKTEPEIQQITKNLENKFIPEYMKRNGWIYTISYRLIKDQQITYNWNF